MKENMGFDWIQSVPCDPSDARNHGVTEDRRVSTRKGHLLRIVYYMLIRLSHLVIWLGL